MAKPPTSVRSIRLPDSMWAELGEMAGEATTVNALVQVAVRRLLTRPAPGPVAQSMAKAIEESEAAFVASLKPRSKASAPAKAAVATVAVPTYERKAFNPQPKPGAKK